MLAVRHSGVWKEPTPYVKHNGTWKVPTEIWVKDAGTWKKVWPEASLTGQDITDTATDPDDAFTGYRINSNGKAQRKETPAGSYTDIEDWLGVGTNSLYEVRGTLLSSSGTATRSGTLDVWLACTSTREWALEKAAIGTSTWSIKIEIRRVSDGVIVASCTVNLESNVDSGL